MVTVFSNGYTLNILHHKEGTTRLGGSGVKYLSNVWMIQPGKCLLLGLESRHDPLGVHAGLDDLQGDQTPDRILLFGQVYDPHAPFTQDPNDTIALDVRVQLLDDIIFGDGRTTIRPGCLFVGLDLTVVWGISYISLDFLGILFILAYRQESKDLFRIFAKYRLLCHGFLSDENLS